MKFKFKIVSVFLLLSSCSFDQESIRDESSNEFLERLNEIVYNPSSYSELIPEKINPFELNFDFSFDENKNYRISQNESQVGYSQLPQEVVNASDEFKDFSIDLIRKSFSLNSQTFEKLAFALELEIINSGLSDQRSEYLLFQLAVLKAATKIHRKKSENLRILCDSQLECDVLACVEEKVDSALDPEENNWIDLIYNTYSMATDLPIWWASCLYDALNG